MSVCLVCVCVVQVSGVGVIMCLCIHVIVCVPVFACRVCVCVCVYVRTTFSSSIHASLDLLAIVNNAAVTMGVLIYLRNPDYNSFG